MQLVQQHSRKFLPQFFSKEYLLYTERAKSFEEDFYNTAARLKYDLPDDHFVRTASCSNNNGCTGAADRTFLGNMNWPSMTNKLGRLAGVPLDTLSFAHYHRGFREGMIIDNTDYVTGLIDNPDIVQPDLEDENSDITAITDTTISSLSAAEFLDYLFLTMLERRPDADEVDTFTNTIGFTNSSASARDILDYISRLPEQYYFNCVKGLEMSAPDPITQEITLGECVQ